MLSAHQVAARLGVKIDTVYAYASRGVLRSHRREGSRQSWFDADDVEALARRGRPRRTTRPAALDLVVETALTTIEGDEIRYRGRDALKMAAHCSFEEAAEWLWSGKDAGQSAHPETAWTPYPIDVPDALDVPLDRIRAGVVLSSAAEPLRANLSTPAVTTTARALIATMVEALPPKRRTNATKPRPPTGIAARLWVRLTATRPSRGLTAALDAALVLLADHELATSTLAARVAASARADPFAVVLAGLGPMAGPLHGGASRLAYHLLCDAATLGPEPALAAAFEDRGHLPGFGHRLYPDGDPRAKLLLDLIAAADYDAPALETADAVLAAARRRAHVEPNVDFALATLAAASRMGSDAGEVIFTLARTAGWIAHAVEEYSEPPLRFRGRAVPAQT